MKLFILIVSFIISITGCSQQQQADLIVHQAKIYTADNAFSTAEAMAIKDGKILFVGTNKDVLKQYKADTVLDADGKTIYPGFIDAHCHFTGYAMDGWKRDLVGTTSWKDVLDSMQLYAASSTHNWLYGRGWDQNDWEVKNFPNNKLLDSFFPTKPVYLKRIDGHAALANTMALQMAGITTKSKVVGGEFVKENGELTGLLIDNAMRVVERIIPEISDVQAEAYFLALQKECFAQGLTGVHDCGVSEHTLELLRKVYERQQLKMKIFALLSDSTKYYDKYIAAGPTKEGRLHVGGFKVYADGALGSRGACLLQDYTDKPGWKGFMLSGKEHFKALAQKLAGSKLQMCTHAIGDSANREILNIYASVLKPGNDRRWRIEHAQVVNPADFPMFKQYNIIPSVQPTHATSDMYWATERLGNTRIAGAYSYKTLLATNGWLPLGTDFPVEYISPFKTFYAAVTRMDAKGFPAGGFTPAEALSRQQALKGMTIWAARAAFEDAEKGSIEAGKGADFIMLDKDIIKCPPQEILSSKVLFTYINGEKVF